MADVTPEERAFLERTPVGYLATADADARPHAVPVCFALVGTGADFRVVTPIDEKPKTTTDLRRVRDVRENPRVALVADRYVEDWSRLAWVQVRGRAAVIDPGGEGHAAAVDALRGAYDQYADHALGERPLLRIAPGRVLSWGALGGAGAE